MIEARLYSKAEKRSVKCSLCSFRCHIRDGKRGIRGVRENKGGTLFTHTWGRLVAENIEPIEKKPLFHFQPASRSYSIATAGCNFRCLHCQNSEISQMPREGREIAGTEVTTEEIAAEEARRERASHELAFQKSRFEKLKIVAPTSGIFAAPRLKERLPFLLKSIKTPLKYFQVRNENSKSYPFLYFLLLVFYLE